MGEFEKYYDEDYKKLVIVDYYEPWAGPCDALKEFWKFLHTAPQIEDFKLKCDIVQLEKGKFKAFNDINVGARPKFFFLKHGRIIPDSTVNGPNTPKLMEIILANIPKGD